MSEVGRSRWPRHRKYLVGFEDLWLKSGRLTRSLPAGALLDLSSGQWRPLFFADESQYPAVQPWHERRKYLCLEQPPDLARRGAAPALLHEVAARQKPPPVLLKFAGLGRYGQAAYARAGQPMTAANIDGAFLDHVVRYLAYLSRMPATSVPMPHEELIKMIEINVTEGLGADRIKKLRRTPWHTAVGDEITGTTDGRMMLHEWLHLDPGYLKTDVDHYADHFSPGCRDIAWDLAGCLAEWGLDHPMQNYLIGEYRSVADDSTLPQRLPFYSIAYLAHRLGYAALATQTLGPDSPDGRRFRTLTAHYTTLLQQELSQL